MSAAQIAELARRGRAAQPGWEALGYEGRAVVLKRMQRWLVDNADQVIATICSKPARPTRTRRSPNSYTRSGIRVLADKARATSPTSGSTHRRYSSRASAGAALPPMGLIGVIGPWNYPLTNSFGDCIPALAAGTA
ncbi:aldehyde dehydrogenase family protein [Mycobacterium ulcerans str. Harvey]|uniref:Aldehyde dehydrogenase family protein n=1 Tax=Mycobacterium ulcerans str. Harvey TaxID=1299332 RepID=A0ABP3A0R7_MYCUL|nr:aldehyde dehydrogenase family protein [Mycobacterium ulcerans str. Harvey]